MATPRLGLVVEDKPTELSCNTTPEMKTPRSLIRTFSAVPRMSTVARVPS